MEKTLSAVAAREKFGTLIDEAYYRDDAIIIERAGKPMAAVVSIDRYRQWQMRRDELFNLIDRVQERTGRIPPAEMEQSIADAVHAAKSHKSVRPR